MTAEDALAVDKPIIGADGASKSCCEATAVDALRTSPIEGRTNGALQTVDSINTELAGKAIEETANATRANCLVGSPAGDAGLVEEDELRAETAVLLGIRS